MSMPEWEAGIDTRGIPWAALGGVAVHSRIDPLREAAKIASSDDITMSDLVVVVGFGLGFTVEALFQANPDRPVIAVVTDSNELMRAATHREASRLRLSLPSESRLCLAIPNHADDLIAELQAQGCRNPALVVLPAYAKAYPELAAHARLAITRFKERAQVNTNTLAKFARLWARNFARNLNTFASRPGIVHFEGLFQDCPGLLIAGGPTLDNVLPYLSQLRQSHVLVAVDTALRACLRAGVDPDFVVMVDPQYWNTRHLDGCGTSKAIVISESAVLPRSLRIVSGPIFFCSSLFPIGRFFEERLGVRGQLGAGGSVATTAWDFLRHCGVTDIVAAGLDLSYPGKHTHFRGSVFEEATHRTSSRLTPASHPRFEYLHGADSYLCPAMDGTAVLTDRRMDVYAHWFENQARQHPQMLTRRFSFGSRTLDGIPSIQLDECLRRPACRALVDHRLKDFRNEVKPTNPSPSDCHVPLRTARGELVTVLQQFEEICDQALHLIGESQLSGSPSSSADTSFLGALDTIDQSLTHATENRIIGFLVEPLLDRISRAAPPANFQEAMTRSLELYSSLKEACAYQLSLFRTS